MTRNQQIIAAYQAGRTITALAEEHQISRQRVNQIVRDAGCPHRQPGMAEKKVQAVLDGLSRDG